MRTDDHLPLPGERTRPACRFPRPAENIARKRRLQAPRDAPPAPKPSASRPRNHVQRL